MEILQQALWCQMKKISSRIWFSSRSSGVLPAPILFRVDFRGLSRRVLWFQAPDSLEAWGWGLGADFGLRDWTRSNRDVSYREVSCWNDDVVVLASLFWLPVVIGDVEASFLTPVIVPLWGSYVSFFWHVHRASSSLCDWNPPVFFSLLFSPLLEDSWYLLMDDDVPRSQPSHFDFNKLGPVALAFISRLSSWGLVSSLSATISLDLNTAWVLNQL